MENVIKQIEKEMNFYKQLAEEIAEKSGCEAAYHYTCGLASGLEKALNLIKKGDAE